MRPPPSPSCRRPKPRPLRLPLRVASVSGSLYRFTVNAASAEALTGLCIGLPLRLTPKTDAATVCNRIGKQLRKKEPRGPRDPYSFLTGRALHCPSQWGRMFPALSRRVINAAIDRVVARVVCEWSSPKSTHQIMRSSLWADGDVVHRSLSYALTEYSGPGGTGKSYGRGRHTCHSTILVRTRSQLISQLFIPTISHFYNCPLKASGGNCISVCPAIPFAERMDSICGEMIQQQQ